MNCEWVLYDDDHGLWETECVNVHAFTEGGVLENDYKFCPYCGGEIVMSPDLIFEYLQK